MSKKVLIFLKSDVCQFCKIISSKFHNIIEDFKKDEVNINIKIINVSKKKFDTTKYPIALNDYLLWFPMFLLMDEGIWEYFKTKTNIDDYLRANIKVLNGVWVENKLTYKPTISIKTNTSVKLIKWFNDNK